MDQPFLPALCDTAGRPCSRLGLQQLVTELPSPTRHNGTWRDKYGDEPPASAA